MVMANYKGVNMKVILFNGSPNKEGNTYLSLKVLSDTLKSQNIDSEIITVGNKSICGCLACYSCKKEGVHTCSIKNDLVNEALAKIRLSDGLVIASPVHFAALSGNMKSFLDRVFMVAGSDPTILRHKVGASVATLRRSGGLTTFDQLNNFLHFSEMFIPASNYWNVVHGKPEKSIEEDQEGVQIMEELGKNMAFLLKVLKNTKEEFPEKSPKIGTNFLR